MQRPSWIWAALPADSRKIACPPRSGLSDALRQTGLEVVTDEAPGGDEDRPDAVLVVDGGRQAAQEAARGAAIATSGVAAVAIGSDQSPSLRTVSRLVRGLQVLVSPLKAIRTKAAAMSTAKALRAQGLEVATLRTGDRSMGGYGLGPGGWIGRRRMPGGAIVIASKGPRPASVVERIVAEAAGELGRPLKRLSADVFPSGKLAAVLADDEGERYFLSITAADAGGESKSEAVVRAILAVAPPASLSERILEPLAAGEVGPVRYVLEPKAPGSHPVWISARLWRESVEFLADLYHLPHRAPGVSLPSAWPDLQTATEVLGRHARPNERSRLERVRRELEDRLSGIATGGGHGDLFTKNLLVNGGSISAVLDWEWASRDSMPLLDLLDLRAQLGLRRRRGLRIGENFREVLWPLAARGGDEPIRSYCQAVGLAPEPRLLEGLAMAHWLLRTARLGSVNPKRLEHAGWWRANVSAPLAKISAEGAF